ncbi:hypothetical protein AKO1_012404 [Acrasis kona]|uniref:Uncharacterized protein n=1 Tax=Acrasis kona TaxID=1008807 RepID=A0AAW2YYF8_9EUKA
MHYINNHLEKHLFSFVESVIHEAARHFLLAYQYLESKKFDNEERSQQVHLLEDADVAINVIHASCELYNQSQQYGAMLHCLQQSSFIYDYMVRKNSHSQSESTIWKSKKGISYYKIFNLYVGQMCISKLNLIRSAKLLCSVDHVQYYEIYNSEFYHSYNYNVTNRKSSNTDSIILQQECNALIDGTKSYGSTHDLISAHSNCALLHFSNGRFEQSSIQIQNALMNYYRDPNLHLHASTFKLWFVNDVIFLSFQGAMVQYILCNLNTSEKMIHDSNRYGFHMKDHHLPSFIFGRLKNIYFLALKLDYNAICECSNQMDQILNEMGGTDCIKTIREFEPIRSICDVLRLIQDGQDGNVIDEFQVDDQLLKICKSLSSQDEQHADSLDISCHVLLCNVILYRLEHPLLNVATDSNLIDAGIELCDLLINMNHVINFNLDCYRIKAELLIHGRRLLSSSTTPNTSPTAQDKLTTKKIKDLFEFGISLSAKLGARMYQLRTLCGYYNFIKSRKTKNNIKSVLQLNAHQVDHSNLDIRNAYKILKSSDGDDGTSVKSLTQSIFDKQDLDSVTSSGSKYKA